MFLFVENDNFALNMDRVLFIRFDEEKQKDAKGDERTQYRIAFHYECGHESYKIGYLSFNFIESRDQLFVDILSALEEGVTLCRVNLKEIDDKKS